MKLNLRRVDPGRSAAKKLFHNRAAVLGSAVGVVVLLSSIALVIHAGDSNPIESLAAINVARPREIANTSPAPSRILHSQQVEGPFVKLVTVTPRGFEPSDLKSSKSRFILMIDSLSGLDEISVQLSRVTAGGSGAPSKLHEVRMPRGRLNWTNLFDLSPGEYVLTEASHPKWVCRISVRPN